MDKILYRLALAAAFAIAGIGLCRAGERDYGRACLALAAFSEQNENQRDGMLLVAVAILNRVNDERGRYGVSICDVVNQSGQFIGIQNWHYPRRPEDTNPARWAIALDVAGRAIDRRYELPGACVSKNPILYFHSGDRPYWTKSYDLICFVDGHYFYAER